MPKIIPLACLLITVSAGALAAPGGECVATDPTQYPSSGIVTKSKCWILCDGMNDTANDAANDALCAPAAQIDWGKYNYCTVSIGKVQSGCVLPSIIFQESRSSTTSYPNLWSDVDTITGVLSPLISSFDLPRRPRAWVRGKPASITDVDCTDVDIIIECEDLNP